VGKDKLDAIAGIFTTINDVSRVPKSERHFEDTQTALNIRFRTELPQLNLTG
jgi:hypothetical protein